MRLDENEMSRLKQNICKF